MRILHGIVHTRSNLYITMIINILQSFDYDCLNNYSPHRKLIFQMVMSTVRVDKFVTCIFSGDTCINICIFVMEKLEVNKSFLWWNNMKVNLLYKSWKFESLWWICQDDSIFHHMEGKAKSNSLSFLVWRSLSYECGDKHSLF